MKTFYFKLALALDKISNLMIEHANRWYIKSKFSKLIKEFIFLFSILPATLLCNLAQYFENKSKN